MVPYFKKIAAALAFATITACSFTPPDPYAQFTEQEKQSDEALTTTAVAFARKYPPSSVGQCAAMTHESYEKGTRCYRVINRNWERDYNQAYGNADKRTRVALKRYHKTFSEYYLAPTTPAKQAAAEKSYEQLQRRMNANAG